MANANTASWLSDPFCRKDFQDLHRQWRRILAVWVFMQFCSFWDAYSMASLQRHEKYYLSGYLWEAVPREQLLQRIPAWKADNAQKSVVLDDAGHNLLPHVDPFWANFFCSVAIVLVWTRFIVLPGPRSMRWPLLRRLWVIVGLLRVIRAVTIQATVLPNPDLECVPTLRSPNNLVVEAFWVMSLLDVTCQDVLYSEHTFTIMIMGLFWAFYATEAPLSPLEHGKEKLDIIVKLIVSIFSFVSFMVIIASRFHYSDDVLLAMCVCGLTFASVHLAIRAAPFHTSWIFKLIENIEGDSPDMHRYIQRAKGTPQVLVDP